MEGRGSRSTQSYSALSAFLFLGPPGCFIRQTSRTPLRHSATAEEGTTAQGKGTSRTMGRDERPTRTNQGAALDLQIDILLGRTGKVH